MRQLTFVRRGRLEWREVAEPQLQSPVEALVRPIAAARCDLDRAFLFGNAVQYLDAGVALHVVDPGVRTLLGRAPFRGPFAYGHECVAEVVACGEAVKEIRVGQRVVVPWKISCGECGRCRRGLTGLCQAVPPMAMYGLGSLGGNEWGGMISDVVRVPFADRMLVRVPEGVDPAALASGSDNLPDAWRTVAPHLKARPGASVLVVGGGAKSIGLYAAAMAVVLGSGRVDYLDRNAERRALAQSLGANALESLGAKQIGAYSITVDASARASGLRQAIRATEPGGVCTSVGIYMQRGVRLPLFEMYAKGIAFHTGLPNARTDLPEVLALVEHGGFNPERVTTRLASWEEAPEALLDPSAKVVIVR